MTARTMQADTIPALLAQRCAATPDGTAYLQEVGTGEWQRTTWSEFAAQVQRLRLALAGAGLRHGDRMALIAPVSLQWECLHHAALGLGVVVVGLDAHDLPQRLADMLDQANVSAIVTSSRRAVSGATPERLAACKLLLDLSSAAPDTDSSHGWHVWTDLDRLAASSACGSSLSPAAVAAGDLATIIFTSGTTGAPKGIAFSHGQVILAVTAICDAFSFAGPHTHLLCWLPLSNLFQRIVNLAALRQGPATYLLGDPRRVMDAVASANPDIFIGVPRFYEKLRAGILSSLAARPPLSRAVVHWAWGIGRQLQAVRRAGGPPPWWLALLHQCADRLVLRRVRAVMGDRLQCMVSGSAPLPRQVLEDLQALGWLVLESYGTSENILPMAMNRIDAHRMGTVGRPVAGNEIDIAADGAIRVRGPGMFHGYLGQPASSALDADGWYQTGDIGTRDADGFLTLTGRSSDLIKTSTGRRIAPAGIESVLGAVPGIDQAIVLGAGRKCAVALCTCTSAQPAAAVRLAIEPALRAALSGLSDHERPAAIALLPRAFSIDDGDLTPNLKMRRDAIARRHAALVDVLYDAIDNGGSDRPDVLVLT